MALIFFASGPGSRARSTLDHRNIPFRRSWKHSLIAVQTTKTYFTMISEFTSWWSTYQYIPVCRSMYWLVIYWYILVYTCMYHYVPVWTSMYWYLQPEVCTGMCQYVLVCTCRSQDMLVCTSTHIHLLVCSSMYQYELVWTSTYWYIPAFTLISYTLMPSFPVTRYITVQGSTMKYPKVLYTWITVHTCLLLEVGYTSTCWLNLELAWLHWWHFSLREYHGGHWKPILNFWISESCIVIQETHLRTENSICMCI
jgi:hypothetical protein